MKIYKTIQILSIILGCLLLSACNNTDYKIQNVEINHFEKDIINYKSLDNKGKEEFKIRYHDLINIIYSTGNVDENLAQVPELRIFTTFKDDITRIFPSDDTLSSELCEIKTELAAKFPSKQFPEIITYITPYNQSIVTTNSTLLIGLNHYLGANHPMYNYFEDYKKRNKNAGQIKFDVAEVISRSIVGESYNKSDLISNMIYEGVIIHIMQELLPDYKLNSILGYTEDEIEWCNKNEFQTWSRLISQDILYSTSQSIINSMINEAPFTSPINQESPGRMGRWIGYKIIENYIDKTSSKKDITTYIDILKSNSQSILIKSSYDGR